MAQQAIQKTPAATFGQFLAARKGQLLSVLPKHLTPERVCRVALNTFNRTPALAKCDMVSVFQAVQQAAELGLEPGGALSQCYLLPYGDKCQLIVSYKGLIELARRSGEILSIEARVIHEHDEYDVEFGLHSDIKHRPCLKGDPGELVMVYAIARLKDGTIQTEVMTRADVESIRRRSRSGKSGPWVTDYEEMARKTVVRRLCKYLPISTEKYALAMEADAADFDAAPAIPVQTPAPEPAPADAEKVLPASSDAAPEVVSVVPDTADEVMQCFCPTPVPEPLPSQRLTAKLKNSKVTETLFS